jgi:hypothetical protein
MAEIAQWAKKKIEEDAAKQRAIEAEQKAVEAEKRRGTLVLKYELPYEATWDAILNELLGKNKYLRLAHYLQLNRGDSSDGYAYASEGLDGFKAESDEDKAIHRDLYGCIEDWDGDGRVFRDTSWNYDRLFAMVPEKLMADYRIANEQVGGSG